MKRHSIAVLITLLVVPLATSFTLETIQPVFSGSQIKYVQSQTETLTNIELVVTGPFSSDTVTLNLENLTSPPSPTYEAVQINLDTCQQDGLTYTCTLTSQEHQERTGTPLTIYHNETKTVTLSVQAEQDGQTKTRTAEWTFTVDDERPVPTYIGPTYCEDADTCTVNPGETPITVTFQAGTGPFNREQVLPVLTTTGQERQIDFVDSCEGSACKATPEVTCSEGQTVTFTLNTEDTPLPSTDDALNPVTPPNATTASCDTTPPTIEDVQINAAGADVPTTTSTLDITANITETHPANITILETQTSATCNNDSQQKTCTVQTQPPEGVTGETTLTILVQDQAGNTAETTRLINLRVEETEETPELWEDASLNTLSGSVNKDMLDIPQRIYAKTTLPTTQPNALLTDIRVDACSGDTDAVKGIELQSLRPQTQTAYFTAEITNPGNNETIQAQNFDVTCNVTAYGATQNTVFSTGEEQQLTLTVPLEPGVRLSQSLQKEIQSTRDGIEEYNERWTSTYRVVETTRRLCQGFQFIESGFGGISGGCGAVEKIPLIGQAIGESCRSAEDPARDGIQSTFLNFISPMCEFATCQHPYQDTITNTLDNQVRSRLSNAVGPEATDLANDIQNVTSSLGGIRQSQTAFNPYTSKYVAIATACIPAYLKHTRVEQQIECSYLNCLTEGAQRLGVSPSTCRAQRSQARCVYQGENIKGIIPIYNQLSTNLQNFADVLNDPLAMLTGPALATACNYIPPGSQAYFACELPSALASVQDIRAKVEGIKQGLNAIANIQGTKDISGVCEATLENTRNDAFLWQQQNTERPQLPELSNETRTVRGLQDADIDTSPEAQQFFSDFQESQGWAYKQTSDGFYAVCLETDSRCGTGTANKYDSFQAFKQDTGIEQDSFEQLTADASPAEPGEVQQRVSERNPSILPEASLVVQPRYTGNNDQVIQNGELTIGGQQYEMRYVGNDQLAIQGPDGKQARLTQNEDGEYSIEPQSNNALNIPENQRENILAAAEEMERVKPQYTEYRATQVRRLAQAQGVDLTQDEAKQILRAEQDVLDAAKAAQNDDFDAPEGLNPENYEYVNDMNQLRNALTDGTITTEGENNELETINNVLGTSYEDPERAKDAAEEKMEEFKQRFDEDVEGVMQNQINYGNWERTLSTGFKIGRDIVATRSYGFTFLDDYADNAFGNTINAIAQIPETIANPHRKFCGQVNTAFTQEDAQSVAVNTNEVGQTSIGAIIAGTKQESRTPSGDQTVTYSIGYKIETETNGLTARIVLRGPRGDNDVTTNITGSETITLEEADNTYRDSNRQTIQLSQEYDRVCLAFNEDPHNYFRRVSGQQGNQICQHVR